MIPTRLLASSLGVTVPAALIAAKRHGVQPTEPAIRGRTCYWHSDALTALQAAGVGRTYPGKLGRPTKIHRAAKAAGGTA